MFSSTKIIDSSKMLLQRFVQIKMQMMEWVQRGLPNLICCLEKTWRNLWSWKTKPQRKRVGFNPFLLLIISNHFNHLSPFSVDHSFGFWLAFFKSNCNFITAKSLVPDIMDPVDDLVSGDSGLVEFDTLNLSVSVAAEDQKQDIDLQNQAIIESDMMMSAKDPEDEFDHAVYSFGSNQLRNEEEVTQVTPKGGEESDQQVIESSNKIEATAIELSNAIDCPPVTDSQMSSCSVICESDVSDQVTPQDVPSTFSFPSDKTSSAELPVDMPFSTLAVDPLPEQMSSSFLQSTSDCTICPASVTPRKKSSSKTPTTSRKISILLDENKENIDNSWRNLDLTKEKGMKEDSLNDKSLRQLTKMLKENIDNSERKLDLTKEKGKKEDSLNDKSMRQLTKMLKEKLQITSKKNIHEEKDIAKVKSQKKNIYIYF